MKQIIHRKIRSNRKPDTKNMKNRTLVSILFLLQLSISCSDDLSFKLPDVEPLLSLQSFVDPDKEFELLLTVANPVQDSTFKMSTDCTVDILEDENTIERLFFDTILYNWGVINKCYLRFLSDSLIEFQEGKEYKVVANHPGFEELKAISVKPASVKIIQVTWKSFVGEMPDWYYDTPSKKISGISKGIDRDTNLIEFSISFIDPDQISNYYRLGINLITKPGNRLFDRRIQYASQSLPNPCYMKFHFDTPYPLYSGWSNPQTYEILWNDNEFNGEDHTIKILVPGSSSQGSKYIVSLYSLNEDYYKYMVSRWKYSISEDDPFAEPVRFFSNTSNGCGIFAFSSLDADTIEF